MWHTSNRRGQELCVRMCVRACVYWLLKSRVVDVWLWGCKLPVRLRGVWWCGICTFVHVCVPMFTMCSCVSHLYEILHSAGCVRQCDQLLLHLLHPFLYPEETMKAPFKIIQINLLPVTHRIRWSNGFTYPITLISLNCCFQDHIKLAPNKRQWTETGREILNCSVRNFFVFLLQNSLLHCALINKTLKVQNDPIEIHVCQIALCYISICKAVNVPPHCINNLDLLWFANHLAVDTTWRHINRAVESGSNSTADYHFMQNISRHEG